MSKPFYMPYFLMGTTRKAFHIFTFMLLSTIRKIFTCTYFISNRKVAIAMPAGLKWCWFIHKACYRTKNNKQDSCTKTYYW